MFGNVGWAEMVVLVVAALVILGPERLPGAIMWLTKSLRQVRDYASGATKQLKDELGPEFEDFRGPLQEFNQLRGMSPRAAITKHLLDGDDSIFTGKFDSPRAGQNGQSGSEKPDEKPQSGPGPAPVKQSPPVQQPAPSGSTPFDTDAT